MRSRFPLANAPKPHIHKHRDYQWWCCSFKGWIHLGTTPEEAYAKCAKAWGFACNAQSVATSD